MRSRRSIQIRRIREWLALCAGIALIPWAIYLALTLTESYTAHHWQAAWGEFPLAAVLIIGTLRITRLQIPSLRRAWWPFGRHRRVRR